MNRPRCADEPTLTGLPRDFAAYLRFYNESSKGLGRQRLVVEPTGLRSLRSIHRHLRASDAFHVTRTGAQGGLSGCCELQAGPNDVPL
jgi:hypothetical protein